METQFAAFAKHLDMESLLGFFIGEKDDVTDYVEQYYNCAYGLKLVEIEFKTVPKGFRNRTQELFEKKKELLKQVAELENEIARVR